MKENEYSSYKDPDSVVFYNNNEIYRDIYFSYKENYDRLFSSGLYKTLTENELLISHLEIENNDKNIYKVIKPEKLFITYPWEWCFSQLKDAALATLKIQLTALEHGMSLKDANCYNIQFKNNKPILIDTTSFEIYKDGEPWVAYKQFCENFLAPLALMAKVDINLNKLLLTNISGISLELAAKLIKFMQFGKIDFDLFFHIKFHSMMQGKYAKENNKKYRIKVSKQSQINLIRSLIKSVKNLKLKDFHTQWDDYYNFTNYKEESFEHKKEILIRYKEMTNPSKLWDMGANTGLYSRLFADRCKEIIAFDIDSLAVEKNYLIAKEQGETNILPIVFDMVNPSPAVGWNNEERKTIIQRTNNPDVVMALALIHHLSITYNVPFYKIRDYFVKIAPYLIIEFVEKSDSKVQGMLVNRKDIFKDYDIENFEKCFTEKYEILDKTQIIKSNRYMYLLRRKIENI